MYRRTGRTALGTLLVLALLSLGSTPARAADELTLALTPALGPNGTTLTLVGKGATPSAETGYLYGGFSTLNDCQTNRTTGQTISGGAARADGDGNFIFKHTVDERTGVGALRFIATASGGRISPWVCFAIIPVQQTFPQTGKVVRGTFLAYWYGNGGLAQQGLPLTDEFEETNPTNGKTYRVQYFERARFEAHPENPAPYTVLLGLLGTEQFAAKYPQGGPARAGACASGAQEFAQTGHCVSARFYAYWAAHGGLTQQGLPLSEEFAEVNPSDNKTYSVQYFERARFEYHPENLAPYNVLLGLLGGEQYKARYGGGQPAPSPSASPSPAPLPGAQLTISPQQGPNATLFILTGTGFAPNTTYYLQIINRDNGAKIKFDNAVAKSNSGGIITGGFSFGGNVAAGPYTANIATAADGGTILATTNFTLTGATGAKPGANIVVTPPQGAVGGRFVITGTGFTAKTTYTLRIQTENRQTTINFDNTDVASDADGVILSAFTLAAARPVGVYIAEIISKGGTPQVVTGVKFTLTAPSATTPAPSPQPLPAPSPPSASDLALISQSAALISAIPDARYIVDSIAAQGIGQSFVPLDGAWGAYSSRQKAIVYNVVLRGYDAHDLAAVMGHEGQHAADFATSGPVTTTTDCYNREARAFITEASLWKIWYGAAGKPNPANDFEREINAILNLIQNDPQRFAAILVDAYKDECGAALSIAATTAGAGVAAPASLAGMPPAIVSALPHAEAVFAFLTVEGNGDTFWPELPGGRLAVR